MHTAVRAVGSAGFANSDRVHAIHAEARREPQLQIHALAPAAQQRAVSDCGGAKSASPHQQMMSDCCFGAALYSARCAAGMRADECGSGVCSHKQAAATQTNSKERRARKTDQDRAGHDRVARDRVDGHVQRAGRCLCLIVRLRVLIGIAAQNQIMNQGSEAEKARQ